MMLILLCLAIDFAIAILVVRFGFVMDNEPAMTVLFLMMGGWLLIGLLGLMFAFGWVVEKLTGRTGRGGSLID